MLPGPLLPADAVKPPAIVTELLNAMPPPAFSTSDNAPPDPVSVIGELIVIPPAPPPAPALSVRLTVVGFESVICPSVPPAVAPTWIFPAWVPAGLEVLTTTDVPPLSDELITAGLSVESSLVGAHASGVPAQVTGFVAEVVVINMLESGSSSHCPGFPNGAAAL